MSRYRHPELGFSPRRSLSGSPRASPHRAAAQGHWRDPRGTSGTARRRWGSAPAAPSPAPHGPPLTERPPGHPRHRHPELGFSPGRSVPRCPRASPPVAASPRAVPGPGGAVSSLTMAAAVRSPLGHRSVTALSLLCHRRVPAPPPLRSRLGLPRPRSGRAAPPPLPPSPLPIGHRHRRSHPNAFHWWPPPVVSPSTLAIGRRRRLEPEAAGDWREQLGRSGDWLRQRRVGGAGK